MFYQGAENSFREKKTNGLSTELPVPVVHGNSIKGSA